MRPDQNTVFLPISELENYKDPEKYFCYGIVFSPETENEHFHGCPPYIKICAVNDYEIELYFEVPEIVAFYGKEHAGYTMKGMDNRFLEGKRIQKEELKSLIKEYIS